MRPTIMAFLAALTLLLLTPWSGCRSGGPSPAGSLSFAPVPAPPAYTGSIDELIGPEGTVASAFVDADYRQLRRRDAITPIYDAVFVGPDATNFPDDELVIGLNINGDARAYPAGILYNREMVNDTVGGVPVLVTWCPLCYTALAHDRRVGDRAVVFGNQGALYKGAMTWYDHGTGSVWSQPLGEAIGGPMVGQDLTLLPSQLTTLGQWLAANPDSLVLASDVPAAPYAGRGLGEDHVVGVVIGERAMAWPYRDLMGAGAISAEIDGVGVVIQVDEATGAVRAIPTDRDGGEFPVVTAYEWAWRKFYPQTIVDKGTGIE